MQRACRHSLSARWLLTFLPPWRRSVKAEAKRQMYLQSTEAAPKMRLVGVLLARCARLLPPPLAQGAGSDCPGPSIAYRFRHKKTCSGCPSCKEAKAERDHERARSFDADGGSSSSERRKKRRKDESSRSVLYRNQDSDDRK